MDMVLLGMATRSSFNFPVDIGCKCEYHVTVIYEFIGEKQSKKCRLPWPFCNGSAGSSLAAHDTLVNRCIREISERKSHKLCLLSLCVFFSSWVNPGKSTAMLRVAQLHSLASSLQSSRKPRLPETSHDLLFEPKAYKAHWSMTWNIPCFGRVLGATSFRHPVSLWSVGCGKWRRKRGSTMRSTSSEWWRAGCWSMPTQQPLGRCTLSFFNRWGAQLGKEQCRGDKDPKCLDDYSLCVLKPGLAIYFWIDLFGDGWALVSLKVVTHHSLFWSVQSHQFHGLSDGISGLFLRRTITIYHMFFCAHIWDDDSVDELFLLLPVIPWWPCSRSLWAPPAPTRQ